MSDVVGTILDDDGPATDGASVGTALERMAVLDGLVDRLCAAAVGGGPDSWRLVHAEMFSGEPSSLGARVAEALASMGWGLPLDEDPDDDHEDDVGAWRRAFDDAHGYVRGLHARRLAATTPGAR